MKIRVTQIKSGIDRPERQKRTLIALGLRKLNAFKELEATPQVLGMIKKVNHLVTVNEVVESVSITPIIVEEKVVTSKSTKKAKEVIEEVEATPAVKAVTEEVIVSDVEESTVVAVVSEEIKVSEGDETPEEDKESE